MIETELCAFSLEACRAAARAGVTRVELCASPYEGGTTPSAALIRRARQIPHLQLSVMIRPRGGDFFYTDDEIVFQEVALYKVPTDKLLDDKHIEDLVRKHNARILEVNRTYTVIEKSGHTDETQALFEELSRYDVMQFVRSGRVAITKSTVEHVSIFLKEQQYRQAKL